ncbi:MAG TPA: thermonuclease family protein [Acetobacteraceae bacterium]|jgi:endonuclease YncB( thermonuclease family)|nr:thermonuclease family protein [Acetobacteraceae bacterium]
MQRTVLAGLVGAVLGAGVVMMAMPAALFGRVPALTGTISGEPADVAVIDGQTLRMHDAVIRLLGISAPPRGLRCEEAAPGYDCGAAASAALAGLVRGHPVTCHLNGRDARGFALGRCEAMGVDINQALVHSGWARARADAAAGAMPPAFAEAERQARTAERGLWHGGADPSF